MKPHVRGQQPRTGLILSHDRKVSPLGQYQASRDRWVPLTPNSFGLPAGTSCPGKTSFCEKCYAARSEHSKGVGANMRHNLEQLTAAGTVDAMAQLIDEMLDRYRAEADRRELTGDRRLFRIHWDGDFFSLDYAQAWAEVLPDYPDIQFWCYTRSFTDPVNVVPILRNCGNLTVYLSVDGDNATAAHQVAADHPGILLAYSALDYATARTLVPDGRRGPVPCPENDASKGIDLMTDGVGACVTCQLCPKGRRDISFATSHRERAAAPVTIRPRPSAPLIPSAPMAAPTRDIILQYLADQGGCVSSPDGWGITKPIADLAGVTPAAIANQYRKLEAENLIGRHQTGKRLYALYLAGHEPSAAPAPTAMVPRSTASPRPSTGQAPASRVAVRRMRVGEQIDAAKERTDDKVVLGAFDRCEEYMAELTDELAQVKGQLAELRAAALRENLAINAEAVAEQCRIETGPVLHSLAHLMPDTDTRRAIVVAELESRIPAETGAP